MRSPFPKSAKEAGQSLVELTISAGILCFIGAMTQQYFQRVNKWEKEALARARVQNETMLWINTIDRDLRLRERPTTGSITAPVSGPSIDTFVHRLTPFKSGPGQGIMRAHYYTYCQETKTKIMTKYGGGNGNQFDFSANGLKTRYGNSHPYSCMAMKNCTGDTYPQVVLTLYEHEDKKLPVYPTGDFEDDGKFRAVLPQLNRYNSSSDRIVAAAYCYIPGASDTDRFIVETAFLTEDSGTRIIRKEVILPRDNMAKIQMLP